MCNFESLYFNDDGYVVRCKHCGHYQLAYLSTMLTLTEKDFSALQKLVKRKCSETDYSFAEHTKSVVIPTPAQGLNMLLTRKEAEKFHTILEEADIEAKTQSLLSLFA